MAAPECAAMTTGNYSEVNKSCRKLIGDVRPYWRDANAGYEALMNISVTRCVVRNGLNTEKKCEVALKYMYSRHYENFGTHITSEVFERKVVKKLETY